MTTLPRPFWATLVMLLALACSPCADAAAPPKEHKGVITAVSDGDTFTVKCCHGTYCELIKVRLRSADCPEVKHYRNEVDQPGGREALDYVVKNYLGKEVIISIRGDSYGRKVCDVRAGETDLASDLITHGHAMVDPRYPSNNLKVLEKAAAEKGVGVWADPQAVPPWTWRKESKGKRIKLRNK